MIKDDTDKFFLYALNLAINELVTDGSLPVTAMIVTPEGAYVGCKLRFTDAASKSKAIAGFVDELKELRPRCAVVIEQISTAAGKGKKRKTSLCVAFQSCNSKFVSMVTYVKAKNGEFVFEEPYFCTATEIILCGHEYFGDAFA